MPRDNSNRIPFNTLESGSPFENHVKELLISCLEQDNFVLENFHDQTTLPKKDIWWTDTTFIQKILYNNKLVGYIGNQDNLFKYLNSTLEWLPIDVPAPSNDVRSIWTKDLKPDIFVIDLLAKKVSIIEIKFQESAGSVDEKLQTAPYKIEMWTKLFSQFGIKTSYEYVLGSKNFWRKENNKSPKMGIYNDIFSWLRSRSIKFMIEEEIYFLASDYISKCDS